MTRPSLSKVTVGYQRPWAMLVGTSVKVFVAGSNNAALLIPAKRIVGYGAAVDEYPPVREHSHAVAKHVLVHARAD